MTEHIQSLTDAELDAIEARANAATQDRWDSTTQGTFDFLIHACNDIPALVAEVRRLRAKLNLAQVHRSD
jgi:hypothetical protein